jgi:hypothetical protein
MNNSIEAFIKKDTQIQYQEEWGIGIYKFSNCEGCIVNAVRAVPQMIKEISRLGGGGILGMPKNTIVFRLRVTRVEIIGVKDTVYHTNVSRN